MNIVECFSYSRYKINLLAIHWRGIFGIEIKACFKKKKKIFLSTVLFDSNLSFDTNLTRDILRMLYEHQFEITKQSILNAIT